MAKRSRRAGAERRPASTPQARALQLLAAVEAGEGYTQDLLRADDPPLVRELALGVARRRLTLDTFHDAFGSRPAARLDEPLRLAARLGLYQLVFLDGVPAHTAVDQTVGALRLASHRNYLNGMLRGFLRAANRVAPERDRGGASPRKRFERPGTAVFFFPREVFADPERDRALHLAQVHGHPPELAARWLAELGEQATIERMVAGNEVPPLELRPRLDQLDAETLVAELREAGVVAGLRERPGRAPGVLVTSPPRTLFASRPWREGRCSVQDPRQRDAVEILAPRPGERIWDACAAPGGKSTQIAEQLAGEGRLVASDVSARRLERVGENLARLGLEAVAELHAHDLRDGPPPFAPEDGFDAILLDAPCSNTAVLDRRPEARWRFSEATLAELVALQAKLIDAARAALRPGGRLVYSVCSFEPEEGAGHGLAPTSSPFVFTAEREA